MTTDPKECSENAKLCVALAAQATDPVVQRRLLETAQEGGCGLLSIWPKWSEGGKAKTQASGLSFYDCYWRLVGALKVSLRAALVAAFPFASAPRFEPLLGP